MAYIDTKQHPHLQDALDFLATLTREDTRDNTGRYRTKSLMQEIWTKQEADGSEGPHFFSYTKARSYYNKDNKLIVSLEEVYLHIADVAEYKFAEVVFKDYSCWANMMDLAWIRPYVKRWRTDLHQKIRSQALAANMEVMNNSKASGAMRIAASKNVMQIVPEELVVPLVSKVKDKEDKRAIEDMDADIIRISEFMKRGV